MLLSREDQRKCLCWEYEIDRTVHEAHLRRKRCQSSCICRICYEGLNIGVIAQLCTGPKIQPLFIFKLWLFLVLRKQFSKKYHQAIINFLLLFSCWRFRNVRWFWSYRSDMGSFLLVAMDYTGIEPHSLWCSRLWGLPKRHYLDRNVYDRNFMNV